MAKFVIGDKVKLASDSADSAAMTVENYYLDSMSGKQALKIMGHQEDWEKQVVCIWRDINSNLKREIFHEDTLIKV